MRPAMNRIFLAILALFAGIAAQVAPAEARMRGTTEIGSVVTQRAAVRAAGVQSADEARQAGPLVRFSADMHAQSTELKQFLFAQLYRHPQVMQTTGQAQQVVRELFEAYLAQPQALRAEFAARPDRHRAVADYIAGMTDRFALREHERLTGKRLL